MTDYRFILTAMLFVSISSFPVCAQNRNFQDLYPNISADVRQNFFSENGILQTLEDANKRPEYEPQIEPPFSFYGIVQTSKPSFIIESVRIIPYTQAVSVSRIYAALSRIGDLAGRTYKSSSRGKEVPLFETATRIESLKKTAPVQDPQFKNPDSATVPAYDSFYILLKDVNFGNSYYKVEMRTLDKGLLFILSNAKGLSYGIIPVIGEGNFISVLYVEPLAEGLLLYNQAGAKVGSFISSRVHMPSAIGKRLDVFIDWLVDGLGQ